MEETLAICATGLPCPPRPEIASRRMCLKTAYASVKLGEETQTCFLNGRADYRVSASDELSAQFGLTVGDWQAGHSKYPEEPGGQAVTAQYVQFNIGMPTMQTMNGWCRRISVATIWSRPTSRSFASI